MKRNVPRHHPTYATPKQRTWSLHLQKTIDVLQGVKRGERTLSLVEAFNIDELHQPFIGYYIAIARGYLENQNTERHMTC